MNTFTVRLLSCFFLLSFIFPSSILAEESLSIQFTDTIPAETGIEKILEIEEDDEEEEVLMLVEQSPRFPGCEDMEGSKAEKEACAQRKMLEYIYGNLKYPVEARQSGTQGQVVIQFVVQKDGSLGDITLLRDIGNGCGEAALKIVESMNGLPEKWTPGKQRGQAVNVKFTLPVKFKLEDGDKIELEHEDKDFMVQENEVQLPLTIDENETIFMIVEQSPRFPGCEDMEGSKAEKEACAQKKMLEYIYGNLKYPAEARENGIQGQVVIQFVVTKDGSLGNIKLVRDLEGGCSEAAMKVVKSMNDLPEKWTPGKQRGQAVNVRYILPVKFKLEDGKKTKRKKNGN